MDRQSAKALAEKCRDAYSTANYRGGWIGCVLMLARRGYNAREIEAILRSKWTRWACDESTAGYGHHTSKDLARFMDNRRNGCTKAAVADLVEGTFEYEKTEAAHA